MSTPENRGNGYDIPQGPDVSTSSIGAVVWPPTAEGQSFERFKGFAPTVVETPTDVEHIVQDVRSCELTPKVSRVATRVVMTLDMLEELRGEGREDLVETIIPLDATGDHRLVDAALVYLGRNHASRPSVGVGDMRGRVRDIFVRRGFRGAGELQPGYSVAAITDAERTDPETVADYIKLYSVFGWEPDEVRDLLTEPANTLIAARFDGRVVASGIAEVGSIQIQRGGEAIDFGMAEVTEAATLVEHRGRGLYTAISHGLMHHLAGLETPPHLVYGEMNSESSAVLRTAAGQGRLIGRDTATEFGFPDATHLPQHVTIYSGTGEERQTKYNDLIVGWLPREVLVAQYGQ